MLIDRASPRWADRPPASSWLTCGSRYDRSAMTRGTGRHWPRVGHWTLVRRSLSVLSVCVAVLGAASGSAAATRTLASSPVRVPSGLGLVSCASGPFCVAASVDKPDVVIFDGHLWSASEPIGGAAPATSLSCASDAFCLLVDRDGEVRGLDGHGWSVLPAQPEIHLSGLSCVSAAFCVGSDAAGATVTFDGSSWTRPQKTGATHIQCRTTAQCIGLTESGVPLLYDGTSWRLAPIPHHWGTAVAVSCAASDLCEAVDDRGAFYAYTNGSWVPFAYGDAGGDGTYSLSCASEAICAFGVPRVGIITFAGVIDSYYALPPKAGAHGPAVSCVPTFCAAVDRSGLANAFPVPSSNALPSGLPTAVLKYEDAMFAAPNRYPNIKPVVASVTDTTVTEHGRCPLGAAVGGLDQSYRQTSHSLTEVTCPAHTKGRVRRVSLGYLDTPLARYRNYKPLLTVLGDLADRVAGLNDPHGTTTSVYTTSSELVVQYAGGPHGYIHTLILERHRHRLITYTWFY